MKRGFLLISLTSISLLIATVIGIYNKTNAIQPNVERSDYSIAFSEALVLNPVDFPGQEGNIRFIKEHIQNLRSTKDSYDLNVLVHCVLALKCDVSYISFLDYQYSFCCNSTQHIPLYLQKRAILI